MMKLKKSMKNGKPQNIILIDLGVIVKQKLMKFMIIQKNGK